MAEARCRDHWAHTSAMMTLLANVHRDRRKKATPYKPADFNPYQRPKEPPVRKASIDVLKRVFVRDRRPEAEG